MKYAKGIFLVMIAVFLLAIATASASDLNDTQLASEKVSEIELSDDEEIIKENTQKQSGNDESEVLCEGEGTYTDLRNEIGNGGNVTLTKSNYNYHNDGDTIRITTSGTIDGRGAVINMMGAEIRVLYVDAYDVTIKNLTFINAYYRGNASAIYFSGSGAVENCNFIRSQAELGGSIVFEGEGSVKNSYFDRNSAKYYDGGAIFFKANGVLENCNFVKNSALGFGGAVSFFKDCDATITNCNFTLNSAGFNGGAVSNYNGFANVANCNFIGNDASYDGGAVCSEGNTIVTKSNFINNTANIFGGAVRMGNGNVSDCSFVNNTATTDSGGAVSFNANGTVTNSNFTKNRAKTNGGAVNMNSGSVSNCQFSDNAAEYNGGAVNMNSGSVSNCQFSDNAAEYNGGGVAFEGGGSVTNSNFTGNRAKNNGGAVNMDSGSVSNCQFSDNVAGYKSGAVNFKSGVVSDCNFTGNSAKYGGAIEFEAAGSVASCTFSDNHAFQGGALYFFDKGDVTNCIFSGNTADYGGDIYSMKWYTTADLCIFKGNRGDFVNVVTHSPGLFVDNFTAVYGSGKILTLDLKSYGAPIYNANILISVYHKDDGSWFGNYSCLSGEGWTVDLPVGSYYAIFDTEYGGFEPLNRSITITLPDTSYWIFVNSSATHNKTVNITAKSNIPENMLLNGKMQFILSNGETITANHASDGTWWAVHTFDGYDVYEVTATYQGLARVIVIPATISISKTPTEIAVENATLDLFVLECVDAGATLTPAVAGNLTFTSSNSSVVEVVDGKIIALCEGSAVVTVSFKENEDYLAAGNKTIIVNVVKYDSKVTIMPISDVAWGDNVTIRYSIENRTDVSVVLEGVAADRIITADGSITLMGLKEGNCRISVLNSASYLYYASEDVLTFNVAKPESDNSTDDTNITDNSTIDTNITDNSTDDTNTTDDSTDDTNITDNSTIDTNITDNSTIDTNATDNSTIDTNTTNNSTIDTNTTDNSTIDTNTTDNSTIDTNTTDNSTIDTNTSDDVMVKKLANPLMVKGKTVKVKFKKLKKKTQKFKVTKVVKFTRKGVGTLTFKKVKGNKKIKINKKTGKITIKKGLKKGTYKVKMKIRAKGNSKYNASSFKKVTFKIKVK